MCDGDYTNNFTTEEIFLTRDDLTKWVREIAFDLDFVVIIISDKANGQSGRKTYVLLDCERGDKYRKYKSDVEPSVSSTRKCDFPFKFIGKPISNGDGWVLKVIYVYRNHDLFQTLVGHPSVKRLKSTEHSLLVDMSKSQVKPANCLLCARFASPSYS